MTKDFIASAISKGFWHQSTDDDGIKKLLQKKN